jgi:hypothetical protein
MVGEDRPEVSPVQDTPTLIKRHGGGVRGYLKRQVLLAMGRRGRIIA